MERKEAAETPRRECGEREELRAWEVAQKTLLERHGEAHHDKPYHSEEHVRRVLERLNRLGAAAGLSPKARALLSLVAAGHDLILHSSVDQESGVRVRARGGSHEHAFDEKGNKLPRNEWESAQEIIKEVTHALGTLPPETLRRRIIALCDATYPEIAAEPAGPDDLIARTPEGAVDLTGYALARSSEGEAVPRALVIHHPYLTKESAVEEFLMAWADIGNIGMDSFEEYLAQGNAEFREMEQRWMEEELPRLQHIPLKRKAEMAHKMLEWWRMQVMLPLMQRNIFVTQMHTMPALRNLTPEARRRISSLLSHFDENAVRAAQWYDKMVAEYGDLAQVAAFQFEGKPEAAGKAFRELLARMGYTVPEPPPSSRGGSVDGY